MKKIFLLFLLGLFTASMLWSQSIAVGTDTPDPAAIMELESIDKGVLISRLTTAQRTAITAGLGVAQEGLLIYNTTTDEFNYWNGTAWVLLQSGTHWDITGNTGIVDGSNFIGTTDNVPFNIRVFNEKAGRISSTGQTFYGYQAGNANTTSENTAIGFRALFSNTTGYSNVALGIRALSTNTTGYRNIAIGDSVLFNNTSAQQNIGIGSNSLYTNTTGYQNIAIGDNALYSNTIGYHNIAIGVRALQNNSSGFYNIATGAFALYNNINGNNNIANGHHALFSNTSGGENIANGIFLL
jgi:hypothetical protein